MTDSLETIKKQFAASIELDFARRRYGIKICNATYDYKNLFFLKKILERMIEQNECGMCDDVTCCREEIIDKINTL